MTQRRPKSHVKPTQVFDPHHPPAGVVALLRQHPLIWGEEASEYDALFAAVFEEIEPIPPLQWLQVKHLTDLAWEIHRYRRLKANIIDLARVEAVEALLAPRVVGPPDTLEARDREKDVRLLAEQLERGTKDQRSQAQRTLSSFGISFDDVTTQAMVQSLPDVMKLESLIASAEGRLVLLMRDVNRLKDDFAMRLDKTAGALQNGTFAKPASSDPAPSP